MQPTFFNVLIWNGHQSMSAIILVATAIFLKQHDKILYASVCAGWLLHILLKFLHANWVITKLQGARSDFQVKVRSVLGGS